MSASRLIALVFGPLTDPSTYRRWVYLILGGALFVPFVLIGMVVVPTILPASTPSNGWFWLIALVAVLGALVGCAFVPALAPAVRVVEVTAVRELLTDRVPAGSKPLRSRCARWFVAHLLLGAVISLITLVVPAWVVLAFLAPFRGSIALFGLSLRIPVGWASAWVPLVGLLSFVALAHLVLAISVVLERLAPRWLGPSPRERLLAMKRQNDELQERNRLARELHDSVGHALSVVTVQAGAARKVLANDPEFAERALNAIEESARVALEDLDYVLGVLRSGVEHPHAPPSTLRQVPLLILRLDLAVALSIRGDPDAVPPAVSREAYRIVQECLTNVLRHAGNVPVDLIITVEPDELRIVVDNPITRPARTRPGGGRGLEGMRERVFILGGTLSCQAEPGDRWRVEAGIPLRAGRLRL
ncbi:sensor histidine kinase [Labedaea rhizosphaerae]|uniref:histidine kinase n=1 Tax=Labedaea rhizosphaerae TaxID=598644 RepID=A0A4R6RYE1_LABRH|nr:histidine kinase [Labedaea rhizosphaerae]TDP92130.1 signal transduction histidine kinase [Labedaea rhizosphaerae]